MLSFFIFILLIAVVIILFALSFVSSILQWIFGLGRKAGNAFTSDKSQQKTPYQKPSSHKKKIFDRSEGEYVEFEEVQ
jgi:hypothetical protein